MDIRKYFKTSGTSSSTSAGTGAKPSEVDLSSPKKGATKENAASNMPGKDAMIACESLAEKKTLVDKQSKRKKGGYGLPKKGEKHTGTKSKLEEEGSDRDEEVSEFSSGKSRKKKEEDAESTPSTRKDNQETPLRSDVKMKKKISTSTRSHSKQAMMLDSSDDTCSFSVENSMHSNSKKSSGGLRSGGKLKGGSRGLSFESDGDEAVCVQQVRPKGRLSAGISTCEARSREEEDDDASHVKTAKKGRVQNGSFEVEESNTSNATSGHPSEKQSVPHCEDEDGSVVVKEARSVPKTKGRLKRKGEMRDSEKKALDEEEKEKVVKRVLKDEERQFEDSNRPKSRLSRDEASLCAVPSSSIDLDVSDGSPVFQRRGRLRKKPVGALVEANESAEASPVVENTKKRRLGIEKSKQIMSEISEDEEDKGVFDKFDKSAFFEEMFSSKKEKKRQKVEETPKLTLDKWMAKPAASKLKRRQSVEEGHTKDESVKSINFDEYFSRLAKQADTSGAAAESVEDEEAAPQAMKKPISSWSSVVKLSKSKNVDGEEYTAPTESSEESSESESELAEEDSEDSVIEFDSEDSVSTPPKMARTTPKKGGSSRLNTRKHAQFSKVDRASQRQTGSAAKRSSQTGEGASSFDAKAESPVKWRTHTHVEREESTSKASEAPLKHARSGELRNQLKDLKIVFTGVFKALERDDIIDKASAAGARVTSAVSGVTDYLVYGEVLEDGRPYQEGSKYKKVVELIAKKGKDNAPHLLNEEDFLKMLPDYVKPPEDASFSKEEEQKSSESVEASTSVAIASPQKKLKGVEGLRVSSREVPAKIPVDSKHELWCEKYRPSTIKQLVGVSTIASKLLQWLENWHSVCILGKKKALSKPVFHPGSSFPTIENPNAKAVLLSGPPGVGKTTTARVVSRACGYKVLEFNASDERNSKSIESLADMITGGYSLGNEERLQSTCVIMDEIDGLSGGDRGGSQAIIKLIEKAKCPIICVCNDRMHAKVRSIASKCYDLRVAQLQVSPVCNLIFAIAQKEKVDISRSSIELMCDAFGNDMRQILNALQLMAASGKKFQYHEMEEAVRSGNKDQQVTLNPMEATKRLLTISKEKWPISQQLDMFFVDYDMIPLLVNENYLSAIDKGFATDKKMLLKQLQKLKTIAADFADSDVISNVMRRDQDWSLLPDLGIISCVHPSAQCRSMNSSLNRTQFPRWLGRNSTSTKNRRLLGELQMYLSAKTTCGSHALKTSGYRDLLYEKCTAPLLSSSKDPKLGAQECIALLEVYGLSKDMLVENMASLRLKSQDRLYEMVESKTKATLTRVYNSTTHALKMNPNAVNSMFKKVQGVASGSADSEGLNGGSPAHSNLEVAQSEDEESENEDDGLIIKRSSTKGKADKQLGKAKGVPAKNTSTKRSVKRKKEA